jgi:hypothetical protein
MTEQPKTIEQLKNELATEITRLRRRIELFEDEGELIRALWQLRRMISLIK